MITEIGIVAGEIWHYLDEHRGSATLSEIALGIARPRDVVLMSAGWLAREGHLVLTPDGSDFVLTLRSAPA